MITSVISLALFIGYVTSVQVTIEEGIVEGVEVNNHYGSPYHSFRGIPYAEPPLQDLRFKAPQPFKPWTGVRQAKEYGSVCLHYNLFIVPYPPATGSEDCLFINVHSPNVTSQELYPVMVWIHGGGFVSGSGDEYKPDFLIRKGVILVTFNYRLEVLGFLSLGTEDAPGNAGMKDQVLAMRWVKKNIRKFGGDPDNITIFGESAGGASVSYHLISPMTKGLFKRAITQSGTANGWWPNTYRARERGIQLAREMGSNATDTKDVYEFLKIQPMEAFVNRRIVVTYTQSTKESPNVYFGIVSEENIAGNEVFFQGDVYDTLRNGIHEGIDVINGYTEDEGTLYIATGTNIPRIFEQANQFYEFFVPEPLTLQVPVVEQTKIGKYMKDKYMNGAVVSRENIDDLLKYFAFENFVYAALSWQKFVAKNNNNNKIYLYKFTCKTEMNLAINASAEAAALFPHRILVGHADDLPYFFPFGKDLVDMNSETFQIIDRATTLWTNFAKYGNPTPDNNLGITWSPYTLQSEDYLDLGNVLAVGKTPEEEELKLWEDLFNEYYPHIVPLNNAHHMMSSRFKLYALSVIIALYSTKYLF
ncbi:unnamed protein product [Pieris brassicae]|uniref:Carboxylic ester hydrolase n=1 Tax=Pieris brassicae TaxID=7116 RepID=A0A9P0TLU3_PIEBR|nr:unnamed protein product [Pieris brassicae]